jgi:hypothetical protein
VYRLMSHDHGTILISCQLAGSPCVCLLVCLFVCLSVCLCPSVCLSVCLCTPS